jgi:hypothetical protein
MPYNFWTRWRSTLTLAQQSICQAGPPGFFLRSPSRFATAKHQRLCPSLNPIPLPCRAVALAKAGRLLFSGFHLTLFLSIACAHFPKSDTKSFPLSHFPSIASAHLRKTWGVGGLPPPVLSDSPRTLSRILPHSFTLLFTLFQISPLVATLTETPPGVGVPLHFSASFPLSRYNAQFAVPQYGDST